MLRAGIEYLEKDDIVRHIVAKKLRGYEGTTRKKFTIYVRSARKL
jgi:hypothetical protein